MVSRSEALKGQSRAGWCRRWIEGRGRGVSEGDKLGGYGKRMEEEECRPGPGQWRSVQRKVFKVLKCLCPKQNNRKTFLGP